MRMTLAVIIAAAALALAAPSALAAVRNAAGPVAHGDEYAALLALAEKGDELESYEWFRRLPPERQQNLRENYKRYRSLNPEERKRLKKRMERFRELPPEEQQQIKKRYDKWRDMSPEERGRMRERYDRYRELPPEKRDEIKKRYHDINDLPSDERKKRKRELKKERKRDGWSRDRRGGENGYEDGRHVRPGGENGGYGQGYEQRPPYYMDGREPDGDRDSDRDR